jgi:hypothetical protein
VDEKVEEQDKWRESRGKKSGEQVNIRSEEHSRTDVDLTGINGDESEVEVRPFSDSVTKGGEKRPRRKGRKQRKVRSTPTRHELPSLGGRNVRDVGTVVDADWRLRPRVVCELSLIVLLVFLLHR